MAIKLYLWRGYLHIALLTGLVGTSSSNMCKQVQQSSTNGSFVASLGCDDDMETFSLTNDGVKESWFVELDSTYIIHWIFVSIDTEAEYEMYVENTNDVRPSENLCLPEGNKQRSLQQLMTCGNPYSVIGKANRIVIRQIGNGSLKLFEVKPLGLSRFNQTMILNSTDSDVVDGDTDTYYHSIENAQASWSMKLNKNYVMKWILLSIRGGDCDVHVKDGDLTTSTSTLLCTENHYGPNCAKCKAECISCSPITGVCYQCHGPFYGDVCQHTCPANCLNSMCDQRTGVCEGCHGAFYGDLCQYSCPSNCLNSKCDQANGTCDTCNEGYHGMNCELLITTNWKTEMVTDNTFTNGDTPNTKKIDVMHVKEIFSERTPKSCNRSCITCNPAVQVCLFCTMYQLFDTCRYKCNEICSGDTCHDLEENCTRNIVEKKDYLDCSKICIVQESQSNLFANWSLNYCNDTYVWVYIHLIDS
ncbi:uncharacterized protein LOC125656540 isoform X2 [Ostrea edulis]|uniref:uncharacterized protein LOC125656540 isoform X2 n=1 Tax=Ostrea edulis TaxID=37623 RepID=UPI0024AE9863|nr:uncharacterized protein LOC125656540 isoform X2 [Ostrea edulis]